MHETKIFTANGEPDLELELSSTTDENGKCYINAKILKYKSKEYFDVAIEDMNKFDMHNCKYFVVFDSYRMDKTYEYIVFTAGYKENNRIIIIDVVNMTYSVTRISGAIFINEFSIDVNGKTLIAKLDVTLTDGYGHKIKLYFVSPIENFERIFENIRVSSSDIPRNIHGSKIKFYLKDGAMSGHSDNIFKHSNKWLEHINENGKEVETMPSKKNETKATTTAEVNANTEPAKKEEPTPREIISQYVDAYDNMTKDAIRGNNVFSLLSPEHRLSIAAHLDQIVEILEVYIGK